VENYLELLNNKGVITLIVFIGIIIFKKISIKIIRKKDKQKDRRHTVNMLKNTLNISFLIFLFVFWNNEFQSLAISIAAFMVAIVIATKEIIQSFMGFLYISSTRIFRIGDWISSGTYTGEVIETDWAKTTLMEVDPENYSFTGKTLFIPNSQLLTLPINNLNFMKRYVHHEFDVVREDANVNPFKVKELLLVEIAKHSEDYSMVAERYNSMIETKLGVKISGADPIIKIVTTELGKIKFHISIFCPTEQVKEIEQKIMEDFFSIWFEQKSTKE
jgi:small-conductance mechanosensitive channel